MACSLFTPLRDFTAGDSSCLTNIRKRIKFVSFPSWASVCRFLWKRDTTNCVFHQCILDNETSEESTHRNFGNGGKKALYMLPQHCFWSPSVISVSSPNCWRVQHLSLQLWMFQDMSNYSVQNREAWLKLSLLLSMHRKELNHAWRCHLSSEARKRRLGVGG